MIAAVVYMSLPDGAQEIVYGDPSVGTGLAWEQACSGVKPHTWTVEETLQFPATWRALFSFTATVSNHAKVVAYFPQTNSQAFYRVGVRWP